MRIERPRNFATAAGLILSIAAGGIFLSHVPFALRALHDEAKAAQGRNQFGGAFAAADAAGVPDDLVGQAFNWVPRHGQYAVELPKHQVAVEKLYNVNGTSFAAAPTLLQNFLLPRRKVKVLTAGTYVICFYCDTHWHHQVRWLWDNKNGSKIGVFRG